jgi:hypothetical protein
VPLAIGIGLVMLAILPALSSLVPGIMAVTLMMLFTASLVFFLRETDPLAGNVK